MTFTSATRRTFATLCVVAALGTAGCTSGSGTDEGSGTASKGTSLIDRAPVASDAEIQATPLAAAIKQRREMVIGGSVSQPLMSQQNPVTGQTEGFDATLGRMLAKYIVGQPNTRIVPVTADDRETILQSGAVDAIIRIYSITPERQKQVGFAGPYLTSGQAIATLKSRGDINTPEDLEDKKVAAVADTTSAEAVRKQVPSAQVQTFRDTEQCVQALEQGKADAYVHDLTVLAGAAQLNSKLRIADKPFTQEPYGIGVQRNADGFKAFVNRWLRKVEASGLWKQAYQDSLGTVVPGDPPPPPKIS